MLLPLPELPDAWDALRGVATIANVPPGGSGPVLIFVAADTDAAAAVRTLTALLKADLVRYEVHPVAGYAHLADVFDVLAKGANAVDPRAVLCINCGANVDIEKILKLADMDEHPPIFVMDSHRPFHLRNISSESVVLIDDDEVFDHAALPNDFGWEDEWGNVSDHDLSDDSDGNDDDSDSQYDSESDRSVDSEDLSYKDSDDESKTDAPQNVDESSRSAKLDATRRCSERNPGSERPSSNPLKNSHENPLDFDDLGAEDEDVLDASAGNQGSDTHSRTSRESRPLKRPRGSVQEDRSYGSHGSGARSPRRRRKRRKARRTHRHDNVEASEKQALREYYANSFLAMSSACLSHNLASTMRRSSLDSLWMAIVGVTSQYLNAGVGEEHYHDIVSYFRSQISALSPSMTSEDGSESQVDNVGYSVTSCRELTANRIAPSTELRLDLVRHWTLYDSLLYSSYTVTRLAAWRQTGRRRLLELLATLGIPLKESKQQWCYMKAECKAALDDRLSTVIRRFDLGRNIQYESFVRNMPGHRGSISASDVVLAISSLLELDIGTCPERGSSSVGPLQERFWRAYDALDSNRSDGLDIGLELAITSQKLSAEIGGDVVERRKFVPSGPFRYVFLRDLQCKEFLVRPLLLKRLALFLIDALIRQGAKDKPFVVLAPDARRGVWLSVAVMSVGKKNDFGARFQKAAEKNGSQIVYNGFDSAVCEIQDGQEVEFIRFLHDVMR